MDRFFVLNIFKDPIDPAGHFLRIHPIILIIAEHFSNNSGNVCTIFCLDLLDTFTYDTVQNLWATQIIALLRWKKSTDLQKHHAQRKNIAFKQATWTHFRLCFWKRYLSSCQNYLWGHWQKFTCVVPQTLNKLWEHLFTHQMWRYKFVSLRAYVYICGC